MDDTKWDEVRLAMYGLGPRSPRWRTRDRVSGYVSDWDGEWFYDFRTGGDDTIEWVESRQLIQPNVKPFERHFVLFTFRARRRRPGSGFMGSLNQD